jgi:hypothetical protein
MPSLNGYDLFIGRNYAEEHGFVFHFGKVELSIAPGYCDHVANIPANIPADASPTLPPPPTLTTLTTPGKPKKIL